MQCSLCNGEIVEFYRDISRRFLKCHDCKAVMLDPDRYVDSEKEIARYKTHNNDVTDPRYQKFVSPITSKIAEDFPADAQGLDFGCGTGPVAAVELEKLGYSVNLYDPFFENHPEALERTYDFIICCEVMEHFHKPAEEFSQLNKLLSRGGKLYCKTSMISEEVDFPNWYYKDDPTHVFFYSEESLKWICEYLGFKSLEIFPKLIVFGK